MSASMLDRDWEAALDAAVGSGISVIEACGGGHIPKRHFDPVTLNEDSDALARFRASLDSGACACVPSLAMATRCIQTRPRRRKFMRISSPPARWRASSAFPTSACWRDVLRADQRIACPTGS